MRKGSEKKCVCFLRKYTTRVLFPLLVGISREIHLINVLNTQQTLRNIKAVFIEWISHWKLDFLLSISKILETHLCHQLKKLFMNYSTEHRTIFFTSFCLPLSQHLFVNAKCKEIKKNTKRRVSSLSSELNNSNVKHIIALYIYAYQFVYSNWLRAKGDLSTYW